MSPIVVVRSTHTSSSRAAGAEHGRFTWPSLAELGQARLTPTATTGIDGCRWPMCRQPSLSGHAHFPRRDEACLAHPHQQARGSNHNAMTPGGTPLTPAAPAAPLSTFFLYGRRVRRPSAPEQVETWFVFPALSGRGSRTRDPYGDGGGRSRGGEWYTCHRRNPVPPGRGDARSAQYDTPHPRRCRGTSSPARCGRGGQACRADPRHESRLCDRCPLYRSCRGEPCLAHPRRTARE